MELEVTNIPQLQKTSAMVSLDPGAAAAPFRAVEQAGRAISSLGQVAGGYAEKRQRLADNAAISRVRMTNDELGKQVQRDIMEMDPEAWVPYAQDSVRSRMEDLDLDSLGVSDSMRQQIELELETEMGKIVSGVQTQYQVRKIDDDNAAIEAEALELSRNGDRDGAVAVLEGGNFTDRQFNQKKQSILDAGAYDEQLRFIDDFETIEEHEEYLTTLDEKKDDKFTQHKNLTIEGRNRLHTIVRSRIKKMKRTKTKAVRDVMDDVATGKIDPVEADAQLAAAGATDQEREYFRTINEATQIAEENDAQIESIRDDLHQNWAEQILNGDRDEGEYLEILGRISRGDFSKSTKLALTGEWIDTWSADISDSKMELVGRGELTLAPEEVQFHNQLFEEYKTAIQTTPLPMNVVGGLMTKHVRDFTDWYRSQKETPSPETLQAKLDIYRREIYGTVSESDAESVVSDM